MAISTKVISDVINQLGSSAGSSNTSVLQVTEASKSLKCTVTTVASCSSLPNACDNIGRLIWLSDICDYRYSDGCVWTRDFSSVTHSRNGFVFSWGYNYNGQLGDNTTVYKSSPVSVVGGFTDWCRVSSDNHTMAIRTNGTLWTWGIGNFGSLGASVSASRSPVSVVGGFTDWCQVSAGNNNTAAVRANGTLWTWGMNNNGQLGDNTTVSKSSPVQVVGGFTDWCQAAIGYTTGLAVRTNGTLWSWGGNSNGQLGSNTIVSRSSPASVVGGFTDWCQVSFIYRHVAAVRTNGTLWTWGCNAQGQLGDNTVVNKSSPVSVVGGFTDWRQAAVGRTHTVAVRTNGTLWAWGCNVSGILGDNTIIAKSSPVAVVGGFTDWCQVAANVANTAAVRTNGTLWTWGSNSSGQLGDGTTVTKSSPVSVVGGFTDWCQVSSGNAHTTAIRKRTVGF